MLDDVYGHDTDGDGFIDTPDEGSIFGYDFDGDRDIDWEDDVIGLMMYEEAQGRWSHQPPQSQTATPLYHFHPVIQRTDVPGWSHQPSQSQTAISSHTNWGLRWFLILAIFAVLLCAWSLPTYPLGWVTATIIMLVLALIVVVKATKPLTRGLHRSEAVSRTDLSAARPIRRRRFSIAGMTSRQSAIVVILCLAVVTEFCGIGAAVFWTINHAPVPLR